MHHRFETINIQRDLETCIQFRRDSYFVSFGTYSGFEADMHSYSERMQDRLKLLPHGNCHLWIKDEIIGQTEMKLVDSPNIGYVSLLYIIPEFRGQGFGEVLLRHAVEVFSKLNKSELQLSVSNSNQQALSFYNKHGWQNLGARPGKEQMLLMSYAL